MIFLGINAFHADSSACLIRDGKIVAAAEEERFRRVKHWAGFPSESIRYCLKEAGATLGDVAAIGMNQDSKAHFWRKVGYSLTNLPKPGLILERLRLRGKREGIAELLAREFPGDRFNGSIHAVEHHLAHLASAYLISPFERAAVLSVDGFGDFASTAWGLGEDGWVATEGQVFFPHSLGVFYQAVTQYLGFWNYGDEYKVMGLAPYGQPHHMSEMRRLVSPDGLGFKLDLRYFRHHRERIAYDWTGGEPIIGQLFSDALADLLGPPRQKGEELTQWHKDIARSAQEMYEEIFFHLLHELHGRYAVTDIALAGGCAMNSVANGKVRRRTPFQRVYVQSAAGDAGGAIGAAYVAWQRMGGESEERFVMDHAYWGPAYSDEEIGRILETQRAAIDGAGCQVERLEEEGDLCRRTAQAVFEGLVVGWFQGRMEWGPRALGNRSILGDPRRADMKDILNLKIKRRESFRPFAPSILREATAEWFEEEDEVPFMMQVFQIREGKRPLIPAVTHVDGSGRLQTVYRETNPRYHRMISEFAALTGVPMVLNTSFNENEPVVCRPEEALDCFLRTRMDLLVMGNWVLRRS